MNPDFKIQEFVPKDIYEKYGDTSWRFICPELFSLAETVKDFFDGAPVTINDWLWGGSLNYRGFRPPDCGVGAPLSAHKRGMAIDFDVRGVDSLQVQKDIEDNWPVFFSAGATAMEDGTEGWTHLSCENWMTHDLVLIPIPR